MTDGVPSAADDDARCRSGKHLKPDKGRCDPCRRASRHVHDTSAKGRERKRAYNRSPRGRERRDRYKHSPKGLLTDMLYEARSNRAENEAALAALTKRNTQ